MPPFSCGMIAARRGSSMTGERAAGAYRVVGYLSKLIFLQGPVFDFSDQEGIADFDLYAAQRLGHNTARHGPAAMLVTVATLVRATHQRKTRRRSRKTLF
jgi:hypothetical protein